MTQRFIISITSRTAIVVMLLIGSISCWPVLAASLDDLRASGAIVERFDGYVQANKQSADIKAAVDKINAERKRIYEKRAASQGVKSSQVGRVYARQILDSAPAGTHFLQENGKIVRK